MNQYKSELAESSTHHFNLGIYNLNTSTLYQYKTLTTINPRAKMKKL